MNGWSEKKHVQLIEVAAEDRNCVGAKFIWDEGYPLHCRKVLEINKIN